MGVDGCGRVWRGVDGCGRRPICVGLGASVSVGVGEREKTSERKKNAGGRCTLQGEAKQEGREESVFETRSKQLLQIKFNRESLKQQEE